MARRVERVQQAEQEKPVEAGIGPFSLADVKKLVEALEGTDVTSLVWSRSGDKVVIRRGERPAPAAPAPYAVAHVAPLAPVPHAPAPAAAPAAAPAPKAEQKPGVFVTSP